MAKKRFSEGLDDLFRQEETEAPASFARESTAPARHRTVGKNFMSDLDALLQEALEESLEKYESNQPAPSGKSKTTLAAAPLAASSGLDALIRQTVDVQDLGPDEQTGKRRLTVAVDKTKLDKLKLIARMENAYLKDLLVGLIDEYIREYGREKGVDL